MKPVLLILGSLVLLVLVFVSGVIVAANVIADPEPHKFANVNTPDLWTSKPKEVDPAKQGYERLPDAPQLQTAAIEPPKPVAPAAQPVSAAQPPSEVAKILSQNPLPANSALDHTATASIQPVPVPGMQSEPANPVQPMPNPTNSVVPTLSQNANVNASQAQFCYARYRSYRVEDNSYQPFDGGPRRQCQAPGMPAVEATAPTTSTQAAAVQAPAPQAAMQAPATRADISRDVASAPALEAPRRAAQQARLQDQQRELPPLPPEAIPTDDEWHAIESGEGDPRIMESAAPVGSGGGSHGEWCANRYRSYQANDNSYQPLDGSPRRTCQSPFG